jgi:diadenosine tetraphosphatase ApaH/serine/threonine PP2A family protein phosphatase
MTTLLTGNFEQAVRGSGVSSGFGVNAERSILWTQSVLRAEADEAVRKRRQSRLATRPPLVRNGEILYVHGSPRNPVNEYLFPYEVHNPQKMADVGQHFDRICFCGHTHVPGVFFEVEPGRWDFVSPDDRGSGFDTDGRRLICNVGSVGQPRDVDPRACYAIFDGGRIWFRRVAYDIDATIRKIYAIPELDNFLGDRLREGR